MNFFQLKNYYKFILSDRRLKYFLIASKYLNITPGSQRYLFLNSISEFEIKE